MYIHIDLKVAMALVHLMKIILTKVKNKCYKVLQCTCQGLQKKTEL